MKKIAVTFYGLMRFWDITHQMLEYWNNLYDDVEFYFFISTWADKKDRSVFNCTSCGKGGFDLIDLSEYNFLTSYEYLDIEDVVENPMEWAGCATGWGHPISVPRVTYGMYKVQKLRKKYEQENNMKFDGVIQTRTDNWVKRPMLDMIRDLSIDEGIFPVHPKLFFTPSYLTLYLRGQLETLFRLMSDMFAFAHPDAMDEYSEMYVDSFITGVNKGKWLHLIHGEQLMNRRIYTIGCLPQSGVELIRQGDDLNIAFEKSIKKKNIKKAVNGVLI